MVDTCVTDGIVSVADGIVCVADDILGVCGRWHCVWQVALCVCGR